MNFKIRDDLNTLCAKCEHAIVVRHTQGTYIRCSYSTRMPELPPVLECSAFQAKGSMDIYDMEQKAWTLEVKAKEIVGFKPPKQKH